MAAGSYDMVVEQGATFSRSLTWRDPNGDPIDLTGFIARLQARARDGSILVEMNDDNGDITLGGAAGTLVLRLAAPTTSGLAPGVYQYDLEVESAGGEVTRLLRGQWIVQSEVTK